MKVILRKDMERIGKSGQAISVKDGFARNYLLPKGLALIATEDNIKKIEQEKKKLQQRQQAEKNKIQELADRLRSLSFTISAEAQNDNLYGSVTSVEISKALEDEGFAVNKNDILLAEPIKKLGIYEVEARLHPEVSAKIKIWVVSTDKK